MSRARTIGFVDDVFERLMDAAGVAGDDRGATLSKLHELRARFPRETPARLFDRARREGAPIPVPRCPHRVRRGECVACEPRIGERQYYTASGDHVHTTPACSVLAAGKFEPIETGAGDGREVCTVCAKAPAAARTATARPATRRARPSSAARASTAAASVNGPARRAVLPLVRPEELAPSSPPGVGDRIDWGGFTGVVTNVGDRGVTLSVDGVVLTAPWGDRATVHRPRPPS